MAFGWEKIICILGVSNSLYYIGQLILVLLLLGGSAFFSGSETAFFNLSRRQIRHLQKSDHKLHLLTATLLSRPGQLLSCLLFGNMVVNVLFFAVVSVSVVRIEQHFGLASAAVTAFVSFCILILLGEILPKSAAYTHSRAVSLAACVPAFLAMKILKPLVLLSQLLIVEPVLRLFLGPVREPKAISTDEFKVLIKQAGRHGLITESENKLLAEIAELGYLKVRDCLRPRVDMIACNVKESTEKARKIMLKHNLTKVPVFSGNIDNVIGLVYFRQILLEPNAPLDKLIQEVNFVPEQKTIESLLEFFRKTGTDTAIVVDEYGGIAGSIALEDIAEELLGPIEQAEGIEPIEQIGPFEYRLAGDLATHDWAQSFGIDPVETQLVTIGGLVTALLGKIPESGDSVRFKNLKFTVERVEKHRVRSVILTLEPTVNNG